MVDLSLHSEPSQATWEIPLQQFVDELVLNDNDVVKELGCYICRVKMAILTYAKANGDDECRHLHVCHGCKEAHEDHLKDHECFR